MFFQVKTTDEVLKIIGGFVPLADESIPLEQALGRILSDNIVSPEDLPGFRRSSMDGYAVKTKNTFGATESLPAMLEVCGEVLMGRIPIVEVHEGSAVNIPTGGMLPKGADGVVMVEYCNSLDEKTIEVSHAISPGENVIEADDDFKKGSLVIRRGHMLRAQDLGVLAGLGLPDVPVFKRPKVAIISSGDEIVSISEKPQPGQVRDINSYTMKAFCRQSGAEPIIMGVAEDNFEHLRSMVEEGMRQADTVWISGGSSVGARDLTLRVFESFEDMELLVHGISISPGKPTIIAKVGSCVLFGLPGHVVSAMVVAEVFLYPFLARLSGDESYGNRNQINVKAKLGRNIESASGREDYIRVKLKKQGDHLIADPIFGKSGLISTLVEADGLLKVDINREGLYRDEDVEIIVFNRPKGEFF